MVIDDQSDMLKIIKTFILEDLSLDVEVICYTNSSIAKNEFLTINPDLVITDICMPETDGFDLITFIKSKSNTPILAITGGAGEDIDTDTILFCAKSFGADFTLYKNLLAEKLSTLVSAILTKNVTDEPISKNI